MMPSANDRKRMVAIQNDLSQWLTVDQLDTYVRELHNMSKATEIDNLISEILDLRFAISRPI